MSTPQSPLDESLHWIKTSILLEDDSFFVINKPSGILTQSTWGVESLQTLLRRYLEINANDHPGVAKNTFVELPHRLDRGTSGAILVARTQTALRNFSEQFAARKVQKSYLVGIEGEPAEATGEWSDWMRKIPDVAKGEIVSADAEHAKQAIANYETLTTQSIVDHSGGHEKRITLLRVAMESGRMHQIRLHCMHRGYPVLGDVTYGSCFVWQTNQQEDAFAEYFALHAELLRFRHPKTAKQITVRAPLPAPWLKHFQIDADFLKLGTLA